MLPVIVESPFSGDVRNNLRYVRAAMHDCLVNYGEAPFASHALYTQDGVLNDLVEKERALGIHAGFVFRTLCHKTVVYIDLGITKGMRYGIEHARAIKHTIENRTLPNYLMNWVINNDDTDFQLVENI